MNAETVSLAVTLAVIALLCWIDGLTTATWLFGVGAVVCTGVTIWEEVRYRVLLSKWRRWDDE